MGQIVAGETWDIAAPREALLLLRGPAHTSPRRLRLIAIQFSRWLETLLEYQRAHRACDHPDVLAHCRGDGPHARGCWVVDLVLGKA